MRTSRWMMFVITIAPIAIIACGSDDAAPGDEGTQQACVPGAQQACACPGGSSGAQRCNTAGTAFNTCACSEVDGGGADGSVLEDGARPVDAAADQAVEPAGPVLVGLVPVNNGGPVGMVVDNGAVIVSSTTRTTVGTTVTLSGSVVSMPAAGGGPVTTLATGSLVDLSYQTSNLVAATATDVFYVTITFGAPDTFDIMKKSRVGAGGATKFMPNSGGIAYLQQAGGFLYWYTPNGASSGLRRSPVGAAANTLVSNALSGAGEFVVAGANAYYGTASINRVAVTGGASTKIVASSTSAALLSLTSDPAGTVLVYHDYSPNSFVYTTPIAGAAAGTLVVSATNAGTETPRIATDGSKVFYVSNKAVKSVPIGGGAAVDLVTTHDPLYLTNDGTHLYWYNRMDKSVWRMKKP
jgi:hypothetical protein